MSSKLCSLSSSSWTSAKFLLLDISYLFFFFRSVISTSYKSVKTTDKQEQFILLTDTNHKTFLLMFHIQENVRKQNWNKYTWITDIMWPIVMYHTRCVCIWRICLRNHFTSVRTPWLKTCFLIFDCHMFGDINNFLIILMQMLLFEENSLQIEVQ